MARWADVRIHLLLRENIIRKLIGQRATLTHVLLCVGSLQVLLFLPSVKQTHGTADYIIGVMWF